LLRKNEIHPKGFQNQEEQTKAIRSRTVPFELIGLSHQNLKKASSGLKKVQKDPKTTQPQADLSDALIQAPFVHLHNHSQFSVLQATSRINQLVEAAAADHLPALALTDHGTSNKLGGRDRQT